MFFKNNKGENLRGEFNFHLPFFFSLGKPNEFMKAACAALLHGKVFAGNTGGLTDIHLHFKTL